MRHLPRHLSRSVAWAVAVLQLAAAAVASGFGVLPLLRTPLSRQRPRQVTPRLSYATALRFRVLVLYRWWRRDNLAARGLAASYLRRAARDLGPATSSQPADPLPVHYVDSMPPAEFVERYVRNPHPVVIRGLTQPARDWSLAGLSREFGDTRVLLNDGWGYRMHPLRDLGASDATDLYAANCEQLLIRHPELLEALGLERFRPWVEKRPYCAQLFIGGKVGRGLYFHCANNTNVYSMLHGRKRWTLVHPAFSYLMYPIVSRHSAYVASIINHSEAPPGAFDLFHHCPRYQVVLEPGDVLFNPPWWWHQVENLDEDTVGCASRWAGAGGAETNALFSFAQCGSPSLLCATAHTLASVLESGGDLAERYRRAAADAEPTTIIERVSHTPEAMERGERFDQIFPRPASQPATALTGSAEPSRRDPAPPSPASG